MAQRAKQAEIKQLIADSSQLIGVEGWEMGQKQLIAESSQLIGLEGWEMGQKQLPSAIGCAPEE